MRTFGSRNKMVESTLHFRFIRVLGGRVLVILTSKPCRSVTISLASSDEWLWQPQVRYLLSATHLQLKRYWWGSSLIVPDTSTSPNVEYISGLLLNTLAGR